MKPPLQGTLILQSVKTVARDTKKFRFAVGEVETFTGEKIGEGQLDFDAGQFVSIGFTEKAWRAYSIASDPTESSIELVVRLIEGGVGSTALDAAQIGDEFKFRGPFGHFLLSEHQDAELIFCGTGTGIAPLRSMILTETQLKNPRKMKLFYGGRNRADVSYLDELDSWSPDLQIRLGFSREETAEKLGKHGEACRITKFLADKDYDQAKAEFYICGNGDMVKSVVELLDSQGIEKHRIFMERFN